MTGDNTPSLLRLVRIVSNQLAALVSASCSLTMTQLHDNLEWNQSLNAFKRSLRTAAQIRLTPDSLATEQRDADLRTAFALCHVSTCIAQQLQKTGDELSLAEIQTLTEGCMLRFGFSSSTFPMFLSQIPPLIKKMLTSSAEDQTGPVARLFAVFLNGIFAAHCSDADLKKYRMQAGTSEYDISVDEPACKVWTLRKLVTITPMGCKLLGCLTSRPLGNVVTYETILGHVWLKSSDSIARKSMRDNIHNLLQNALRKIDNQNRHVQPIISVVRGSGLTVNTKLRILTIMDSNYK